MSSTLLDKVSPSQDRFQRGKKDRTKKKIPSLYNSYSCHGKTEQNEGECDDINSGSAVVLWPMEKGVEGDRVETRGTKGGGGQKSGRGG